jgi:uncharacterized cupin superfamily protein
MTHGFVLHIPDLELEPEPLAPEQIVSGTPEVTGKVVWESEDGRQARGVWQITPGVVTVRRDQRVTDDRGRGRAVLREGDRTTWTVHEALRKAYAINL